MDVGETCRACGLTAEYQTEDGHTVDPCLGPPKVGVRASCCGHGELGGMGCIEWDDGTLIYFRRVKESNYQKIPYTGVAWWRAALAVFGPQSKTANHLALRSFRRRVRRT